MFDQGSHAAACVLATAAYKSGCRVILSAQRGRAAADATCSLPELSSSEWAAEMGVEVPMRLSVLPLILVELSGRGDT